MMFEGTYTSDFYRAVRNLLHDQISLQTRDSNGQASEHHRAKCELDSNWRQLLARERQYRSPHGNSATAR